MNKEQEKFMIKNQKLDELCEETQDYGRMQFIDKIADLEIQKDNLIKYLEDKICLLSQQTTYFYERDGKHIAENDIKVEAYQDILEKVKSDKV